MQDFDKHSHWERIYQTKNLNEASGYQPAPITLQCITVDHPTAFNTVQHFTFCSFKKKSLS